MGGKGSGTKSQTYKAMKVQEVLNLSEEKLIRVLRGETDLPESKVVSVALELYKKRIPQKMEGIQGQNQLTVVKIIKNHLPNHSGEVVDVDAISEVEKEAEKVVDDRLLRLQQKIERSRNTLYSSQNEKIRPDTTEE